MCHFALTRSVIQYIIFFLFSFQANCMISHVSNERWLHWTFGCERNAESTASIRHLHVVEFVHSNSDCSPIEWRHFAIHLPYQIHNNNFSGSVFSVQLVMGVHSYYDQMIRWSNWNSTPLFSCPISRRTEGTRIVEQWIKTETNYYLEVDMYQ